MPFTSYYLDFKNELQRELDIDDITSCIKSSTGVLWIDIDNPDETVQSLLLEVFNFHPLVVDISLDAQNTAARVEDFGNYVFVNARSIDYTLDTSSAPDGQFEHVHWPELRRYHPRHRQCPALRPFAAWSRLTAAP